MSSGSLWLSCTILTPAFGTGPRFTRPFTFTPRCLSSSLTV